MRTFDVTLKGFDGGTDKTDHLVKWVRAENRSILDQWLKLCGIIDSVSDVADIEQNAFFDVSFDDGVDVKLSLVMPDPDKSYSVKNCGEFFQITREPFDAQNWVKESRN